MNQPITVDLRTTVGPIHLRSGMIFYEDSYIPYKKDLWYTLGVPLTSSNQDVHLSDGPLGILYLKVSGKNLFGCRGLDNASFRTKLFKRLKSLNLKPQVLKILQTRAKHEIARIDQEYLGILDSLLLFDPSLFSSGNQRSIKRLVRKIIHTSVFSTDRVTFLWKEFTNYVYVNACKLQTLDFQGLSRGNFFKSLLTFPRLAKLISEGLMTKPDATSVAHLLSTRQLAHGGKAARERSLIQFHETTSHKVEIDSVTRSSMSYEASQIGSFLRPMVSQRIFNRMSHISFANSGTVDTPVAKGGRGSEMVSNLTRILTEIPSEDKVISTPWGDLSSYAGIPPWRSWCRPLILDEDPITNEPVSDFLELKLKDYTLGVRDRLWGADYALGDQILNCAFLCAVDEGFIDPKTLRVLKPLEAKILTVPEPGGKSRIVSTTKWWNNVLQQPFGHLMRMILEKHPSLKAGLRKADQAWHFVKSLKCDDIISSIKSDLWCISSDLKEATDCLDPELIRSMVQAFFDSIGAHGPLITIGLNLLTSQRLVIVEDTLVDAKLEFSSHYITQRGIFMGEAGTKGCLALYGLCVEQVALRAYLNYPALLVSPLWRHFRVGGDDHIGLGPKPYLDLITDTHLKCGSKLSFGKHGLSTVAVKYCEKIIMIRPILSGGRFITNFNTESMDHPFVDSVKIRLLSPLSVKTELRTDVNPALGKAAGISSILSWCPSYLSKMRYIIRNRFLTRMGIYLPRLEGAHPKLARQLQLKLSLGGLGLMLPEELPNLFPKLPEITKRLLCYILDPGPDPYNMFKALEIFRRWITSGSLKAYALPSFKEDALHNAMLSLAIKESMEVLSFKEVKKLVPFNEAFINEELRELGWVPIYDAVLILQRGNLFNKVVKGLAEPKAYKTKSLLRRFQEVWQIIEDENLIPDSIIVKDNLTLEEWKIIDDTISNIYYVNIEQVLEIRYFSKSENREIHFFEMAFDRMTESLPILSIDIRKFKTFLDVQ
jgi:hypothetical protein